MFSGASDQALKDFTSRLLDPKRRPQIVSEFEEIFGNGLINLNPSLGSDWKEALRTAGAWLDVPSPPKFDNVELMVGSDTLTDQPVSLTAIFPIRYWIQAYEAHRYHVRVFAFSEFAKDAQAAAIAAMRQMLKVEDEKFYEALVKRIL